MTTKQAGHFTHTHKRASYHMINCKWSREHISTTQCSHTRLKQVWKCNNK